MKLKDLVSLALAATATAAASVAAPAWADYPEKVVKIVVPYGAGGGVDTFTRPVALQLASQLGQQFLVDNRAGAGGTIGVQAVARSSPDGYTLLSGGVHQPMAEGLYADRGYDFGKDFTSLGLTAVVPNVLVINPKLPVRSVPELIAFAKQNPNRLNYCSSGSGTSQHIVAETFKGLAKVSMLHVPHKGTAPAMATLLSGDCDLMFDGLGTSAQQINAGRLIALALTSAKRSPYFPAIPTMAEAGGPSMDIGTWYGLWAPAHTPPDVVGKLRLAVQKSLNNSALKEFWKLQGAEMPTLSPEHADGYVRAELVRWTESVNTLQIQAN